MGFGGEPSSGHLLCENLVFQLVGKFLVLIFGLDLLEDVENGLVLMFEKAF